MWLLLEKLEWVDIHFFVWRANTDDSGWCESRRVMDSEAVFGLGWWISQLQWKRSWTDEAALFNNRPVHELRSCARPMNICGSSWIGHLSNKCIIAQDVTPLTESIARNSYRKTNLEFKPLFMAAHVGHSSLKGARVMLVWVTTADTAVQGWPKPGIQLQMGKRRSTYRTAVPFFTNGPLSMSQLLHNGYGS